jgi:hypothetical protein
MLLGLQAALLAASVPVVYRIATRRATPAAAWTVCFAYAAGWAFQTMVNFSFHEVAWGVPILALALDALDRGDDRRLLLWAVLLLSVREDMGILLVLLGGLRLLRPRPRRLGVALIVLGVAGYELATAVVLPAFAPGGHFAYWQYGPTLGADLPHAVLNLLLHPWRAGRLFFTPWAKTQTLVLLLGSLLFLPLRSRYAVLALPLLAQRFFEPKVRDNLWFPAYHYNALPWVILTVAMIDAAGRLGIWARPRLRALVLVLLAAAPVILIVADPAVRGRHVAPLHGLFTGQVFATTDQMRAQQAVVDRIPRNVCVEADDRLAGHLTARDYVTLPPMQHGRADFVAIDLAQKDVGNFGPTPATALATALGQGYVEVFQQRGLRLLRSATYRGPSPACHPLGSGRR